MNGIYISPDQTLRSYLENFYKDLQKADSNSASAMYTKLQLLFQKIKTIFDLLVTIIKNYEEIMSDTPCPAQNGKEKYKLNDFSWFAHDSNLYRRAESHLFTFSQDYLLCHGECASKARKTIARQMFYEQEKKRVQEVIDRIR